MAYKPPINLREIKKTGILEDKRFFKLISEQNNYVDEDTIRNYYMGMVKVVTAELRENGIVRLPFLGDFALIKQKDRVGLVGKTKAMIRGAHMLKFYVNRGLKDYFVKFAERSGDGHNLDPRAKVLGKDITD